MSMDIKELRDKTDIELERLLAETREKVRGLRFRVAAKQLSTVREIREARKTVARILTLLKDRRSGSGKAAKRKAVVRPKEAPVVEAADRAPTGVPGPKTEEANPAEQG